MHVLVGLQVTGIPQPGKARSKARSSRGKVGAPSNPATPAPSATKQVAKGFEDDAQNVAQNTAVTPGRITRRRRAAMTALSD
jgi:hypothetical protein